MAVQINFYPHAVLHATLTYNEKRQASKSGIKAEMNSSGSWSRCSGLERFDPDCPKGFPFSWPIRESGLG